MSTKVKDLHTGVMIKNHLRRVGLSPAELARRLEYTKPAVTNIMKRTSMQTDLLVKVSNVLEHNFFNHFADIPEPVDVSALEAEVEALQKEVGDVRKENTVLQNEVTYLKKIVELHEQKNNSK